MDKILRYEMIFKTVKESSIQDISNRKVGLKIVVINCSQLYVKTANLQYGAHTNMEELSDILYEQPNGQCKDILHKDQK